MRISDWSSDVCSSDLYITNELPALIAANFPADMARQSIFGHSMGGHGALTIALRNPGKYRSVSAFAPISPMIRKDPNPDRKSAVEGQSGTVRVDTRGRRIIKNKNKHREIK